MRPPMNATNHNPQHREAMAARSLLPVDELPDYPTIVAGARCSGDRECLCARHRRINDHARLWRTTTDELVLTAEPYDIDGHEFN